MRLRHREKESFYHSLAQLLRSGITLPVALEKLTATASDRLRRLVERLRAGLAAGQTAGDAFGRQRPAITAMEVNVIAAVERGGRLDHGLDQLAEYFGALARARETVIRKSGYPLFLLHFGVLALALPTLVNAGPGNYYEEVAILLGRLWAIAVVVAVVVYVLRDSAAVSAPIDRVVRKLPLIGRARRCFATARFFMIYEVQLDAGVNVIDALMAAGRASRSGLLQKAVEIAVPEVRGGAQVGPLLALSGAFPEAVTRAVVVAEETGQLDREHKRLASEAQTEAFAAVESAVGWATKTLYLSVVLFLAWKIMDSYRKALSGYEKLLDL